MPKVDTSFHPYILNYQIGYPDGEDIIVFSVVYPADLDSNQIRSGFIKNIEGCLKLKEKTLKFKAIRMSIEDLGKILD